MKNYFQDSSKALEKFVFYKESKLSDDSLILKGYYKENPDSHVIIRKQNFQKLPEYKQRLQILLKAIEEKIVLAVDVFIEEYDKEIFVYTVEPQPDENLTLLADFIKQQDEASEEIFISICKVLKRLHLLGEPHQELAPGSILIQNKQVAFLRPFAIEVGPKTELLWYTSPEENFGKIPNIQSDIFSLGCIYCELFLTLTPLLQSFDSDDKIRKCFEILGVPSHKDVTSYMPKEIYQQAQNAYSEYKPLKEDPHLDDNRL